MAFDKLLKEVSEGTDTSELRTWFMNGELDKLLHFFKNGLNSAETKLVSVSMMLEGKNPNNSYIFTDSITRKLMESSYFSEKEKDLIYALLNYHIARRLVEVLMRYQDQKLNPDSVGYR